MIRIGAIALLAVILAGCGAAGTASPRELGVTARDAYTEARTLAVSWSPDARLRWVEGENIDARGVALPDRGAWSFHYTAPQTALELVVRVSPLELVSEEHRVTSPPGIVIGDRALDTSWLDSGPALEALAEAGAPEPPISMLLVPTRPPQWVIGSELGRRWHVHAETGEVMPR